MLGKKGQMMPLVGTILGIMVGIVILISAVLPVIQSQITAGQATGSGAQNTITTSGTTSLTYDDLIPTTFAAVNCTGSITYAAGNYTLNNPAGTVTWSVAPATLNCANVTYDYYADTYIHNQTVITLLTLIPLFLVLIVLIGVVALIRF